MNTRTRSIWTSAIATASTVLTLTSAAFAGGGQNLPPFDFSDSFYLANGIDPTTLIGRPNGTAPGSILDNTENGPNFNNVRLLDQTAAFDDSGHPIFFSVTGLPTQASFLNNAAGQHALAIAEQFKVYEFPRAANAPLAVFPKRQDLIADLSGGYFSNDPLGIWQINLVRYTPAAFNTSGGQNALAAIAANNGVDLDGTPLIRTKSEIQNLASQGFVTIETPPLGGPGFRWFFCPVIKDPRDGAIAPDAHLTIIELADGSPLPAERENFDLFGCLQSTGDECDPGELGVPYCGALPNSTGVSATLEMLGTATVSANNFALRARNLPPLKPALFFAGTSEQNVPFHSGRLCIAGPKLRFGNPVPSNGNGQLTRAIDLAISPAAGALLAGTTWDFQTWYRDVVAGAGTTNFSHARRVTFQ
jgi:hypothetical protein